MPTSRASIPALFVLIVSATSSAQAEPPEVSNLAFDSETNLIWDAAPGAIGYHLYQGSIAALPQGDQGGCVGGSILAPTTTVGDIPALGEGYFFLTSAYDETGEGVLGISVIGVPYVPQPACIPSRRTFPLIRLIPNDGLPGGDGEAALNATSETIWQGFMESVEVLTHSGELVVGQYGYGWGLENGVGLTEELMRAVPPNPCEPDAEEGAIDGDYEEDDEDMLGLRARGIIAAKPGGGSTHGRARGIIVAKPGTGGTTHGRARRFSPEQYIAMWEKEQGRKAFIGGGSDSHGDVCYTKLGGRVLTGGWGMPPAGELGKLGEGLGGLGGMVDGLTMKGRPGDLNKMRGMLGFLKNKGGKGLGKLGSFSGSFGGSAKGVPRSGGDTLSGSQTEDNPTWFFEYRSGILYDGPVGHGWDFPANAHLSPEGAGILLHDGAGRVHLFDSLGGGAYRSPRGVFSVLFMNADGSLSLRRTDGIMDTYRALDGSSTAGALLSRTDDAGGLATFLYDYQGLLATAVDTLGRATTFSYDTAGRITVATDFMGRTSRYEYDTEGRLVAFTTPEVVGTPNGNDFPSGKRTEYTYSDSVSDTSIRHNLIAITAPNETAGGGPPRVQIAYGQDPASFDFDRVVSATVGAPPASGGTMTFAYAPLNPAGDPADPAVARRHTAVLDENGNVREYLHNANGHMLALLERTNRDLSPGEPDYLSDFSHDAEGRLLSATSPEGTRSELTWDLGADGYRQGNLLELRVIADSIASGGRGDGHGGELPDLVWHFSYEPMRNGLASSTDPLGRVTTWQYDYQEGDPATSGILQRAVRYGVDLGGIPLGLGDLNGDGRDDQILALPVRIQEPTVVLEPGSRQAVAEGDVDQERVKLRQYNDHGQLDCETDEIGNRDCFTYHPETDPDGDGIPTPPPPDGRSLDPSTGGYLATEQFGLDAVGGATVETAYRYRADGALAWARNGRGVSTVFTHNELGQIVEVREAASTADAAGPHGDAPTGFGEPGLPPIGRINRYQYNLNDHLVRVEREDIGETRQVGSFVSTEAAYDLLGQLTSVQEEIAAGVMRTTAYEYDAAGNLIRVTSPEGRAHEFTWDERSLLLTSTAGASGPLGGAPATRRYDYDGAGSLTRLTDARGGVVDYGYDGLGRRVHWKDQIGGEYDSSFDAASNVTRLLARGHAGGPTPSDRSGATNVDLAETLYDYDEAGRPKRLSRPLIMPRETVIRRPAVVLEGPLVLGDGAVNALYEYDAAGRLTFATDDMGSTTAHTYDIVDRLATTTRADGSLHTFVWNASSDLGLLDNNDPPFAMIQTPARFQTSYFYDALDQLAMTVDNAGRAQRFLWDSLGDLGATSDARGPAGGGSIIRNGMVVPINGHGNVTRYAYDAAGRMLRSEQVLTASAEGDGTLTPAPAPTTFNPDGLRSVQMTWGADDTLASVLDDAGNETLYEYDNLGRLVREQADDGTATLHGYDTEDNPVLTVNANGTVVTQTFEAGGFRVRVNINPQQSDDGTTLRQYEYDGLGRVTLAFDNNMPGNTQDDSVVELFYDSLDRVIEEVQRLSNGTPEGVIDSHWLGEARRIGLQGPTGPAVVYSHDALNRVTSVSDPASGMSATYEYLGPDRVARRTFGNGVQTTMLDNTGRVAIGYDAAGQLRQIRHMSGGGPGATLLAGFQYTFDGAGNRVSQRRTHQPALPGTFVGERYAWDSAGRMTSFAEGPLDAAHNLAAPASDAQSWALDGNDNWAQFTRNGVPFRNTPNNLNEYDEPQSGGVRIDDGIPDDFGDNMMTPIPDGTNQGHDKCGNQVADGALTYRYDADGRPVWVRRGSGSPPIAEYAYDAFGRRVWTLQREAAIQVLGRFYFDASSPIEEWEGGVLERRVVYGLSDAPIFQVRGNGTAQYLLEDGEGSTVAVLPDGGAVVAGRMTYDAYGVPTFEDAAGAPILDVNGNFVAESPLGVKEGFLGIRYDPETGERTADPLTDRGGLYCALGVCYDPDQGRGLRRQWILLKWNRREFLKLGEIWFDTYDTRESVHLGRVKLKRGRDLKHFRMVTAGPRATSFSVAAITTVQTRGTVNPGPPHLSRQRVARLMGLVNERRGVW